MEHQLHEQPTQILGDGVDEKSFGSMCTGSTARDPFVGSTPRVQQSIFDDFGNLHFDRDETPESVVAATMVSGGNRVYFTALTALSNSTEGLPEKYPKYSTVLGKLELSGYVASIQTPTTAAAAGQAPPVSAANGAGNGNLTANQPAAPVVSQAYQTPPAPAAAAAAAQQAVPTPPSKKRNSVGAMRISAHNFTLKALSAISVEAKLPQCQVSAVELLTFFPNHTQWPKVMMRLIGTGWTTSEVAKATLYCRNAGSVDDARRRGDALRWQVKSGGKLEFGVTDFKIEGYMDRITDPARVGAVGTYDASVYTTRAQYANDVYLSLIHI